MPNPPSSARTKADAIYDDEDSCSAVSWSAIFGGTFAAAALSFILLALGSGLGLAAASPFSDHRISAGHFTMMAAIWLIIVQWISSALGGYLTGRLRTKWSGVHTHEVFFRDTAHGFLTWAVATVLSVALVMGMAASAAGGTAHMASRGAKQHSVMMDMNADDQASYAIDSLFRSNQPGSAAPMDADAKAESVRILMKGVKDGSLPDADKSYLAQVVSARTGLSQPDAETKIDEAITQIRQAMNDARKAAATVSIFTFLSMLIGAFIASTAAAIGGRQRDEPYPRPM